MSALASGLSAFAASVAAAAIGHYYKGLQAKQPPDPSNLRPPRIDGVIAWLTALLFALITLAAVYTGGRWVITCFFTVPLVVLSVWWAKRVAATRLQQVDGGFKYWTSRSNPRTVLWRNVKKVGSNGAFCFDLQDGQRVRVTESLVGLRALAQRVVENVPDERLTSLARRRCNEILSRLP
jgi:hypothetical protein